jgi:hypothetical protein
MILLNRNCGVEQKDGGSQTILHVASTDEVGSLLLRYGCKTEACDVQGRTALDLAVETGDLAALMRRSFWHIYDEIYKWKEHVSQRRHATILHVESVLH